MQRKTSLFPDNKLFNECIWRPNDHVYTHLSDRFITIILLHPNYSQTGIYSCHLFYGHHLNRGDEGALALVFGQSLALTAPMILIYCSLPCSMTHL